VVGWHLDQHIPTELVLITLTLRQPAPGLIIHADHGSQYNNSAVPTRIEKALASSSRPGKPYDNAQAEAGWSRLKTKLLPHSGAFVNIQEARLDIAYYLDNYFNLDRLLSALGYRSRTNLNATFKSAYLSSLSVFTGPLHKSVSLSIDQIQQP
jgi:putative transposase